MAERGATRALRAWVPRWWRGEGGVPGAILDPLLWPAERLFALGSRLRSAAYGAGVLEVRSPPIPVISVGNLAVGGAGKTPVASWIVACLLQWERRPAVVLRGYGEDEILVHQELNPGVPVLAARRRIEAVNEAAGLGCDVAVLDDAFQHRGVARHADVVLVAAETWDAPRRLLPRGAWREGPEALRRADLVMVTRKSASREQAEAVAAELRNELSVRRTALCHLAPAGLRPLRGGARQGLSWLAGREVLAVASLADPAAFAAQLRGQGAHVDLLDFPDHHDFSTRDVAGILRRAGDRTVVMTRKEAVKLRPRLPAELSAWVLEQSVVIEAGASDLERVLRGAVER